MRPSTWLTRLLLPAALMLSGSAFAQHDEFNPDVQLINPHTRMMTQQANAIQVTGVEARVSILEQSARTHLEIKVHNPTGARLESQLLIPAPDGAVIHRYAYSGLPSGGGAELLPRDEARRIYDQIVAQMKDPALLEFVGLNAVRSSVFPVEPGATETVTLEYEHICAADGGRIDYVLPRSESVAYATPWRIAVDIQTRRPLSTVYSPSHMIAQQRVSPTNVRVGLAAGATTEPGTFRLSYLVETGDVTASLFAYPTDTGGYFLLLAGLPADPDASAALEAVKREVTLVIDRSGSMQGEKLEQAREAALQVLAGLDDGEAFNILVYNEAVDRMAVEPVIKTDATMKQARTYLESVKPRGGTNIHDALNEALLQPTTEGMLPIVLFLTDGLPTVGQTAEGVIKDTVLAVNTGERRIFTFGVGVDVNTPLLEDIAYETRGTATFVLPGEDVEVHVAGVFRRLAGPLLAAPVLTVIDDAGRPAPGRVRDVMPVRLPDVFEGDQVLVIGEYIGDEPLGFRLGGDFLGRERKFRFNFPLDDASVKNAFVPRLWASRKIGVLIDAIREMGASTGGFNPGTTPDDPRIAELVDEVIRLSTEFGVLTEYTAFLAREGNDFGAREANLQLLEDSLDGRAIQTRSGLGSVNQDENLQDLKFQSCLNFGNSYWTADMERVSVTTVQQMADLAFYKRGNRWVDSRAASTDAEPVRIITLGSEAHALLIARLERDGRQGCLSLPGEVLMLVDGDLILVTN